MSTSAKMVQEALIQFGDQPCNTFAYTAMAALSNRIETIAAELHEQALGCPYVAANEGEDEDEPESPPRESRTSEQEKLDACGGTRPAHLTREASEWVEAKLNPLSPASAPSVPSGLYRKYIVSKADGSPVDPKADYFVLRLDTDPRARHAARAYARNIAEENPELARDLEQRCTERALETLRTK